MKNTPVRSSRRRSNRPPRNKRLIAVLATLGVFGAIVTVTQVSNAGTWGRNRPSAAKPCPTAPAPATSAPSTSAPSGAPGTANPSSSAAAEGPGTAAKPQTRSYHDHGAVQHPGDGQEPGTLAQRGRPGGGGANCTPSPGTSSSSAPGNPAALEPLGADCSDSDLQTHDGFQNGPRCVGTAFGEVGAPEQNPSLLITQAPNSVRVNQQFTLQVSTRNLVRDRFLPAGQGGYYKESSFLTEEGLVRGHFHSACRMLGSSRSAPDPAPVPAFFVATEDGRGGARPDTVTVTVPGLTQRGTAQCAVWAGDGSHRIPMMTRANQVPAFDVVRITVR
ncbi:Pecanex-like protein 1 [Plantactinospora sp. BC1]|uniref:Pecanex-like protein 1 n=1 Tax=Plantactinospora sp. BC1 TaxID=2108470 RepID=UPI001F37F934|nr:Pecanex-like protein 1 [Plantactinospora sp. BC1]